MGDIADMILEGFLCEDCGGLCENDPPGHPQKCEDCKRERMVKKRRRKRKKD